MARQFQPSTCYIIPLFREWRVEVVENVHNITGQTHFLAIEKLCHKQQTIWQVKVHIFTIIVIIVITIIPVIILLIFVLFRKKKSGLAHELGAGAECLKWVFHWIQKSWLGGPWQSLCRSDWGWFQWWQFSKMTLMMKTIMTFMILLQGAELVVKGSSCTSGGRQVFIPLVMCTLHFYKLLIKIW